MKKITSSNIKKKVVKKNPMAKILRTPMFKSKIKPSSKIYNRKKII
jgi:stalled ribosome alternative rescue factor ArfA